MRGHRSSAVALLPFAVAALAMTCAPPVRRSTPRPPGADELAQLWIAPADIRARDLFYGPGGRELAPPRGATFTYEEKDLSGFSAGYDVTDDRGRLWGAKLGPEAQTEVVASRLYWAIGYHQPPTYHLAQWRLSGGPDDGPGQPARFRPEIVGYKVVSDWDLHENPFVGTQPYRGLLVMHLIVNNWDVKPSQNKVYERDDAGAAPSARAPGPRRLYVARDLGAAFGRPRWPDGTRGDPEAYERHPFILRVRGPRLGLPYSGRHDELLRQIGPADVCWTARLLGRLTPEQKRDAFRAGAYPDAAAEHFIARFDQKVAEGLKLCAAR